jgi:hypothetical protein
LQISNLAGFAKVHRRHPKLRLPARRARPIASLSYARGITEKNFGAYGVSTTRPMTLPARKLSMTVFTSSSG